MLPPIDLSEIRDFFELVEVVDRAETFETRDAEDLRDEREIKSGAICYQPGHFIIRICLR